MEELIIELRLVAPYALAVGVALLCILAITALVKKLRERHRLKLQEQMRQNNFIYHRLLEPTDLDNKVR